MVDGSKGLENIETRTPHTGAGYLALSTRLWALDIHHQAGDIGLCMLGLMEVMTTVL